MNLTSDINPLFHQYHDLFGHQTMFMPSPRWTMVCCGRSPTNFLESIIIEKDGGIPEALNNQFGRIFHEINHPAMRDPPFMETSQLFISGDLQLSRTKVSGVISYIYTHTVYVCMYLLYVCMYVFIVCMYVCNVCLSVCLFSSLLFCSVLLCYAMLCYVVLCHVMLCV